MKNVLYIKCLKTIISCATLGHLEVAVRYITRAKGLLSDLSYAFIAQTAMEKYIELKETEDG